MANGTGEPSPDFGTAINVVVVSSKGSSESALSCAAMEEPIICPGGQETLFEWTNTVIFVPLSGGILFVSVTHKEPASNVSRYCMMYVSPNCELGQVNQTSGQWIEIFSPSTAEALAMKRFIAHQKTTAVLIVFIRGSSRGVTTHVPELALACPQENAFGMPEWACFQRCLLVKMPVSFWTAAKLAKIGMFVALHKGQLPKVFSTQAHRVCNSFGKDFRCARLRPPQSERINNPRPRPRLLRLPLRARAR
jgi:hypothetical protein